jgi:hypothetical protein
VVGPSPTGYLPTNRVVGISKVARREPTEPKPMSGPW